MLLGAHCSTAGGLSTALERATSIGASSCQIFVKNNMQWFGKPYPASQVDRFCTEQANRKLSAVFGHTGYLINIAAPPSPNRDTSIKSLVHEIELATQIGLPFLVLHPGAHLGTGEAEGLKLTIQALNAVFQQTRASKVRIALENTAGQGTCLGARLEHLASLFQSVARPERLGICLDTAHFFAAGYDIRTPKGWDATLRELESSVGLEQVLAFHLNDSKTDLGSRVDRHEHIGKGKIGLAGFRHIVNDPRFADLPGCLETPKSKDLREDIENLRTLQSLVGSGTPKAKARRRSRARPSRHS